MCLSSVILGQFLIGITNSTLRYLVEQLLLHCRYEQAFQVAIIRIQTNHTEMPEQTMFTEFLMNIASSAFVYLGLVEHPATGRRQVDLMAAKETIDVLVMLHEKTNGNLTRGEARFYEDLLADLQTQFVSMRK